MNEFCVIRREMQKLKRMNGSLVYGKGIMFPFINQLVDVHNHSGP